MKSIVLLILFLVTSCASRKDAPENLNKVTNDSFKKEKPLKERDVADFYSANIKAVSPALDDETLDRYTIPEVSQIASGQDQLLEIAVKCAQGDFNEAFATASKAFHRYQKIAAYWNQVANCHLKQGSERKALLFYNKAMEVTPNYVPALNNIGVLYSRQGQDQKALIAFERANKQSKFSKTPRYNLAKLYLRYGLSEQALSMFNSLLEDSPKDVDLLQSVASAYYLMSDYQKAVNTYQRIPSNYWVSPEIGLNLAMTLKKLGRTEDAKKVFNSLDDSGTPEIQRYRSVIAAELGER